MKVKEFQDVRERQNDKWKGISAYSSFQSLSHVWLFTKCQTGIKMQPKKSDLISFLGQIACIVKFRVGQVVG